MLLRLNRTFTGKYGKWWKNKITNSNEPINSILQRINVVHIVLLKTHFMKRSFRHFIQLQFESLTIEVCFFLSLVVWKTCNWYTINGWLLDVFEYFRFQLSVVCDWFSDYMAITSSKFVYLSNHWSLN